MAKHKFWGHLSHAVSPFLYNASLCCGFVLYSVETTVWSSDTKETRPESANSRSGWGLDGDDGDGAAFSRQKATGIDMQSGAPPMVSTHQALGINDSFMSKLGRGVRCTYLVTYLTYLQ